MQLSLGSLDTPELVEKKLGYRIPQQYHEEFKEMYSRNAKIEETGIHIFEMPPSIHFKGDKALEFIMKVFTPENLVESKGYFPVIRQ